MNRVLKRPMFRIGGSAGTGITSGLDRPTYSKGGGADRMMSDAEKEERAYNLMRDAMDKQRFLEQRKKEMEQDRKRLIQKRDGVAVADGGRIGYQQGSMPSFQASGLPGFLTQFGLNLLSTPPQGNIFQTAATAARDPFNRLQVSQARARELQGERDFLRSETDRKLTAADERLEKEIASREKIAGMQDVDKNVMAYAEIFSDPATNAPNIIKGKNAVDFFETKYNELRNEYGDKSVGVEPIDATRYQTKKQINNFKKQNPDYLGKIYFDVASGKAVKFVRDVESGDLKLVPVDSADIDTTGEAMPDPNTSTPGLFGQKTKPDIITPKIKELGEEFSEEIYQTP